MGGLQGEAKTNRSQKYSLYVQSRTMDDIRSIAKVDQTTLAEITNKAILEYIENYDQEKKVCTLDIEKELLQEMKEVCKKHKLTQTAFINTALELYAGKKGYNKENTRKELEIMNR